MNQTLNDISALRASRRASFALSLLAVVACLASQAGASAGLDGPVVVMEMTTRDFGEVFAGEELQQIFLVRNAGTKSLELSRKSSLAAAIPHSHDAGAVTRFRSKYVIRNAAAMRAAPS